MEKDKSIIKEALNDYNAIKEAAIIAAQKKLAEEYSEKFNQLLKEQLNNNKKIKEQSNIVKDNNDDMNNNDNTNNDSVMEKQKKETNKVDELKENVVDNKDKSLNTTTMTQNKNNNEETQEEFNITELDVSSVGSTVESVGDDDELITLDDIEKEINSMKKLGEDFDPDIEEDDDDNFDISDEEIDEFFKSNIDDEQDDKESEISDDDMNDVNDFSENFDLNNEDIQITDEDIDKVMDMDETLGMSFPNKRATTANLPGKEYQSQGNVNRMRYEMRESKIKINSLINENKKLTKKLNDINKRHQYVVDLIEQYKSALEKYRNQLKEMAVFNTNLAHVNNLLVNENLALTYDDKIKIINEFKNINTISESQDKYNELLSEMKENRNTISENVENKVVNSIHPSSKQKLDEVIEKTAYENNEYIHKMKKLINYGKK